MRAKPTVEEALALTRAIYARPGGSNGCCLHLVLDDDNCQDHDVALCVGHAFMAEHADCLRLACMLAAMAEPDREAVAAMLAQGGVPIDAPTPGTEAPLPPPMAPTMWMEVTTHKHPTECRCLACRLAAAANSPEPDEIVWRVIPGWDGTRSDARFKGLWLLAVAVPLFTAPAHIDAEWTVTDFTADHHTPPRAKGAERLLLDMTPTTGALTIHPDDLASGAGWDRSQVERARQRCEQEAERVARALVQP